jgi:SET domain-containing protein
MMLVKTYLGISEIQGIGLFAGEPIRKDTVIWRFEPLVDQKITVAQLESLPLPGRDTIEKYSYRHRLTNLYILCADDMRFMNHSSRPNCLDVLHVSEPDITVALKDIAMGEEMTCDYSVIDQDLIDGKYSI